MACTGTEWTREEDEENYFILLSYMPTQWRTIAPISKPARPDPVDRDEDEKEMLSEARARHRRRKRKGIDYNAEFPLRRGLLQAHLRKQDAGNRIKLQQRQDAPSAILHANKLNDPETVRKRSKLMLPPPQISDHELDEIARLGYATDLAGSEELTEGSSATRALLANYAQTPSQGMTPLRTPQRTPAGGENPELHPSDFSGVTPKKKEIQTPNPMLTPSATPGGTPGGAGLTPRSGMTPARDGFSIGITPKGTPLMSYILMKTWICMTMLSLSYGDKLI
ncbi:putative cell division cycle 5-like protein isoform X1 [Sesbania bispinosa]|nr:putative cell division cycle 5-like protein isoform X1 [Sesbania bispinosa]